jgi:hypothetical protein
VPAIIAGPAQVILGHAGLGDEDLNAGEATRSLDAVVEAETRNSSRPGSQAHHAPPALTFGLPGKQRVNLIGARHVLMCRLKALTGNVSNLVTG